MNKLQKLDHNGIKVLTSKQLAECYETETNNLKNNFKNHKNRFIENEDYYKLEKEELKQFKNLVNDIDLVDKHSPILYLWAEQGCLKHAKILDTDKAWQVYNLLIETYFKVKEQSTLDPSKLTRLDILRMAIDSEEQRIILEKENKTLKKNEKKLENKIEQDKPKVTCYNEFITLEGNTSVGTFAKICCKQGFKIGKNKMFELLREKKILIPKGTDRNNPYQQYIDLNWFVVIPISYKIPIGKDKFIKRLYSQTRITAKGQVAIWRIIKQNVYKEQIELLI